MTGSIVEHVEVWVEAPESPTGKAPKRGGPSSDKRKAR